MRVLVVAAVLSSACGAPSMMDAGDDSGVDAGVDAGADAGTDAGSRVDAGTRDAGFDAGMVPFDAGPPPPPTSSGSMTVNGVNYSFTGGFGTLSMTSLQLVLLTPPSNPLIQLTMVLPPNATAGSMHQCGGMPTVLLGAQWRADGGTAFYTLNQTCDVNLTQLAADVGDDYAGTFSGTVDLDPRSVHDAGFQTMTITNGTFTVQRF